MNRAFSSPVAIICPPLFTPWEIDTESVLVESGTLLSCDWYDATAVS